MGETPGTPRCLVFVLAALLLACGSDKVGRLERYDLAVREAAGLPHEAVPSPQFVRLPPRRERRLSVGDPRIGWLDFLAVQGCRWGGLIGERNSPLGRVMPDARRVSYEVAFLQSAEACLERLTGERRQRFEHALGTKRTELPRHVWNALWAGPEMERFLAAQPGPQLRSGGDASAALADLIATTRDALEQGRAQRLELGEAHQMERALGELLYARPLGPLLRETEALRFHLARASTVLRSVSATSCSRSALRLTRLFRERYVPVVQRQVVVVNAELLPLLAAIDELFLVTQRALPSPQRGASLGAYHQAQLRVAGPGALWPAFRSAVVEHAQAWSPILAACEATPGGTAAGEMAS